MREAECHLAALGGGTRRYTLLEVMAAVFVIAFVAVATASAINFLKRSDVETGQQCRALLAMDNSLERIAAAGKCDSRKAAQIFNDEFSKSGLAGMKGVLPPQAKLEGKTLVLRASTEKGKVLAEVKLKCEQ